MANERALENCGAPPSSLLKTTHPNSTKQTVLLSMFKAGDSTLNLLSMYQEHIMEAQGMQISNTTAKSHTKTESFFFVGVS